MSVGLALDQIPERLARLGALCEEQGRKLGDLWLCHKLFLSLGQEKPSRHGGREPGTGSADAVVDDIRRIRDLGYRTMIFRHHGLDAAEQLRQFDLFADKVLAKL
jgi:hypothetical protein